MAIYALSIGNYAVIQPASLRVIWQK